jgi:hypothetical protein
MPRSNIGSVELGLTEDTTGLDLEGVSEVKQGVSKFADFVISMEKPATILIANGTICDLQIKGAKPGSTAKGFPKLSILYVVDGGIHDGETFYDDLNLIPASGTSRGTMWRYYQFLEAVKYKFEVGTVMTPDNVMELLKELAENILGDSIKAIMKINPEYPSAKNPGEMSPARNGIGKFLPQSQGTRSIDDLLL